MKTKLLSFAVTCCLFSLSTHAASVPVITGYEFGYDPLYRLNVTSVQVKFQNAVFFYLERSTDQVNYTPIACGDKQMGIGQIDDQIQTGMTYWYQVKTSTQPVSCATTANWSSFSSPYKVVIPPEIVRLLIGFPSNGKITGYADNQIIDCGGTSSSCQFNVPINTHVVLNAAANNGYSFNNWIDNCPTPTVSSHCEFDLSNRTEIGVDFISQFTPPAIPVNVTSLTLSCPSSMNENSTGGCSAVAYYSNGTSKPISPSWSANSNFLSINSSGVVSASSVSSDTNVAIMATYSEAGKTVSGAATITIRDISPSPVMKVTSVSPLVVTYGKLTTFTVIGTNLPNTLAFWIDSCAGSTAPTLYSNVGGTLTTRTFTCTPLYSRGIKAGVVKDKSGGTLLSSFNITVQ